MNWEAFLVIGLFILALGALLYIPGRIWAKRRVREGPNTNAALKVTKAGFVFFGILTVVLMVGVSLQYFAPESELGQFVKTSSGRLVFFVAVGVVFLLLEYILKSKGIMLVEKKADKVSE